MSILTADYSNLNHEEMAKQIGLKPKHMPMLIASFLEEASPTLEAMQSAIASHDFDAIRLRAHSIKGSAGNLRFNEIYEMSKEMEHSATEQNKAFEYKAYFEALKKAITTIPA